MHFLFFGWFFVCFFFSSRRRHTRWNCDWSSDVCSSDLQKYSDHIFLGMSDGVLLESEDGGATWIVRTRFDDSPTSILQNPSRLASLLIVIDSGTIQTTNDFGKTWEKVSMGEGGESPGSVFFS